MKKLSQALNIRKNGVFLPSLIPDLQKKDFIEPSDLLNEKIILPRRNNIKNELSAWFGKDITKLKTVATHNLNSNTAVMDSKAVGTDCKT